MLKIDIQKGTENNATVIADLIKKMVLEMEQYGGHKVNESPAFWSSVEALVRANSTKKEYHYLLANYNSPAPKIVGMAAANIQPLEPIFIEKTRLHLSAIYTIPDFRRQGVARQLIRKIMEWGTQMNAEEADLNVLSANPALQLYEKQGFDVHEVSLVKKLNKR